MKVGLTHLGVIGYIIASSALVFAFPQSVLAFLCFEASLLVIYHASVDQTTKFCLGTIVLLVLLPLLGSVNGYYLEVAIQVGIFVALALGLNIVVGFVGLLNLGFVAFYAIGAYLWAIFGSPQANHFLPGNLFPLSSVWFFPFLLLSVGVGALTGALLGLPVLRLRGDYLAVVTLGFAEVVRALVNNFDKPINITNGPKGITPIEKPPLFFQPLLEFLGFSVNPSTLYPFYFYFLVLLIAMLTVLVTRRLEESRIGRAWKAIREDEIAAAAMGIPVVRMKLLGLAVFCLSRRRAVCGQASIHQSGELYLHGIHRGARHGDPRRHGLDSRRDSRRHRRDDFESVTFKRAFPLAKLGSPVGDRVVYSALRRFYFESDSRPV